MENKQKITITQIDIDTNIENSEIFQFVLKIFNEWSIIKYNFEDIKINWDLSINFYNLMEKLIVLWSIKIKKKILNDFLLYKKKLKQELWLNLKDMNIFYNDILKIIFKNNQYNNNKEAIKEMMLDFECAYPLMKKIFLWRERMERQNWKAIWYFEHLKWVMKICLYELPNPNLNKIIIALLHDSLEDIPWFTYNTIDSIFWEYIAKWVLHLTKKHWNFYLNEKEKELLWELWSEFYDKYKKLAKDRRREDYFGSMKTLNDNYLDVKLADRIHNLRTLDHMPSHKIEKKIKESEKYFLELSKKRNYNAYVIIKEEITILREKHGLK